MSNRYLENPYCNERKDEFMELLQYLGTEDARTGQVLNSLEGAVNILDIVTKHVLKSIVKQTTKSGSLRIRGLYKGDFSGLSYSFLRAASTIEALAKSFENISSKKSLARFQNLLSEIVIIAGKITDCLESDTIERRDDRKRSKVTSIDGIKVVQQCLKTSHALAQFSWAHVLSETYVEAERHTFVESDVGIAALMVLFENNKSAISRINVAVTSAIKHTEMGSSELLYGQAGVLSALLFVRYHKQRLKNLIPILTSTSSENSENYTTSLDNDIKAVVRSILSIGASNSLKMNYDSKFGLMYSWHDSDYLGAAHGLAGILYVLNTAVDVVGLSFLSEVEDKQDSSSLAATIKDNILACIDAIVDCQYASGNFPTRCHNIEGKKEKLVQWCHGSPGIIPLLCMFAREDCEKNRIYRASCESACANVWSNGLLRKGVGLCHGISGNGYSFLYAQESIAMKREDTMDYSFLAKAIVFSKFAHSKLPELFDVPDHPYSLFEGVLGLACFDFDVSLLASGCKMVGFPAFSV